jgi:hypothetical protein
MTADEEQSLRELSDELAAAERSTGEPRCITRAFASRTTGELVLTMQGWIDLEEARSPLLEARIPDGDDALEQLNAAVDAFRCGPLDVTATEAARLAGKMLTAVQRAFGTVLPMSPPNPAQGSNDGFGTWLPVFTCLVSQVGLSRREALDLPVEQAHAIVAAMRHNEGWSSAGVTYAQRNIIEEVA